MKLRQIQITILVGIFLLSAVGFAEDTLQSPSQLKLCQRESIDDEGYKSVWYEYYNEFGVPVKNGLRETFYPNGKIFTRATYEDNQLVGGTTTWYENGQKKITGQFIDDEKHGLWRHFYEDGSRYREIEYVNDRPHGKHIKWHKNGQIHEQGHFKYGRRYAFWTTWYFGGQKRSAGEFIDGKRDSSWVWWHKNGQVSSKGIMKIGKRILDWRDWYDNGQVEKSYSYDSLGVMQGLYYEFYPDGSKKVEGFSVGGKKHGLWREWDSDGNLVVERQFEEGELITDSTIILE